MGLMQASGKGRTEVPFLAGVIEEEVGHLRDVGRHRREEQDPVLPITGIRS